MTAITIQKKESERTSLVKYPVFGCFTLFCFVKYAREQNSSSQKIFFFFYSRSSARQLLFIEGGTILQSHLIAVVSVQ